MVLKIRLQRRKMEPRQHPDLRPHVIKNNPVPKGEMTLPIIMENKPVTRGSG